MMNRRQFVKQSAAASFGLALSPAAVSAQGTEAKPFVSQRPPPEKRRFTSPAIEKKILEVKAKLKDPELAWMFENCFPNTLDTTVTVGELDGKPDTYVITGDINAMWLRDSAAQVWPYLPFMREDPALAKLITGVVNRHARSVLLDPYANAFYRDGNKKSPHADDITEMRPGVHERKWEVDSLCYVIRLAHGYWKARGDVACFDQGWLQAMKLIVRTFKEQQRKEGLGPYCFIRKDRTKGAAATEDGYGNPAKPNGLICSLFRPSDDGTTYLYLIPSNFMAVVSLRQLAEMVKAFYREPAFAAECTALADEVQQALRAHASVRHKTSGDILAYEVDGFGKSNLMDDSNVPSLLSLPYLGAVAPEDMALYQNTRKFLLSPDTNYFYVKGTAAEGTSGPHAGRNRIWPMGIIMRAMTTDSDEEIATSLRFLKTTHDNTGFMHEAFHKDDPHNFTRKWFAWANTLFGEFILKVLAEKPHLLT